jgi:transcriptional regulator with XRE-family HTH domain
MTLSVITPHGRIIRHHLRRLGWNQGELSQVCGIDRGTISRFMSGDRFPFRDHIEAIAKALGLEGYEQDELFVSAGYCSDAMRDHVLSQGRFFDDYRSGKTRRVQLRRLRHRHVAVSPRSQELQDGVPLLCANCQTPGEA